MTKASSGTPVTKTTRNTSSGTSVVNSDEKSDSGIPAAKSVHVSTRAKALQTARNKDSSSTTNDTNSHKHNSLKHKVAENKENTQHSTNHNVSGNAQGSSNTTDPRDDWQESDFDLSDEEEVYAAQTIHRNNNRNQPISSRSSSVKTSVQVPVAVEEVDESGDMYDDNMEVLTQPQLNRVRSHARDSHKEEQDQPELVYQPQHQERLPKTTKSDTSVQSSFLKRQRHSSPPPLPAHSPGRSGYRGSSNSGNIPHVTNSFIANMSNQRQDSSPSRKKPRKSYVNRRISRQDGTTGVKLTGEVVNIDSDGETYYVEYTNGDGEWLNEKVVCR